MNILKALKSKIKSLPLNFLFKIISPPFCENCRQFLTSRTILCLPCKAKIVPVVTHELVLSKNRKIPVYAIGAYSEPLKDLVLAKRRSYRLATVYLADLIYEKTIFSKLEIDFLIPVPLHWSRILRRGYNQSLVMANRLQQLQPNLQVADILKRKRATKYQTGLSKLARAQNLTDAFGLKKIDLDQYRNKNLVLIDDVFTSGATLAAAAQELYQLRPKTITIVVACRAI